MRKKNGFTLVELLVVIALMLSILGIAIVNLVNVSDKKKEESWKDVISQIETAATEYFTANEYLFEGLENGATGRISVGRLVEYDYLNAVTNPVTEKKVSECAVVTVKKENDKYTSSFDDKPENVNSNETSCDSQSLVITSDVGKSEKIPDNGNNTKPDEGEDDGNGTGSALLKGICLDKSGAEMNASDANGYCYQKQFQLNIKDLNKKGTITSVKYCNSNGSICKVDDVYDVDDDVDVGDITNKYNTEKFIGYDTKTTNDATTVVDIYNQSGTLTRIITYYKIDHDDPIVSISLESSDSRYYTADPTIYINGYDKHSGIDRYENENFDSSDGDIPAEESVTLPNSIIYNSSGEVIEDFSGETTYPKVTIYDKVGNYSSSDDNYYTVYKTCDKTTTKYCKHTYTYSYDCDCDKKGKNCDTCYGTGHYYNEYYIDKFNDELCGGDDSCKPNPKLRSRTIKAKAYKFADLKKFCSNTGTFNFNHAGDKVTGGKINKSPKGAYRSYEFKELECSCTLSNKKITVNKVNNITDSTHPDGRSYIFYKSKDACVQNDVNKVKQVCTQQITGSLNYHGVKWNQGNKNYFSNEGWYFNSYKPKKALKEITSEKQACKMACESKAGIN